MAETKKPWENGQPTAKPRQGGKPKGEYHTGGKKGNPDFIKDGFGYQQEMRNTEEKLGDEAKARRRLFAAHYIKTTNATAAAEFAGFKSPRIKGAQLKKEPYVQDLIHRMLNALDLDAIMTQQEVLFRFKEEANDTEAGNQGARISALAHIAKIHGMMIERQETTINGGGVMVVPAVTSPDDWGKMAAEAQAKLKQEVKD